MASPPRGCDQCFILNDRLDEFQTGNIAGLLRNHHSTRAFPPVGIMERASKEGQGRALAIANNSRSNSAVFPLSLIDDNKNGMLLGVL
jgi:hypothetical protein